MMKLDRNIKDNDGRGKYALLKLRELDALPGYLGKMPPGDIPPGAYNAIKKLENVGVLDWGKAGTESEFFVIRLKDKYAASALFAYAEAADDDGQREWGAEVRDMARRAGTAHPNCKRPD